MQSLNAERSVIGALLIKPDAFDLIDLKTTDFRNELNAMIYGVIAKMVSLGKPVDVITVAEDCGGNHLSYLGELAANVPTAANIKHYAGMVRKARMFDELNEIGADIHARTALNVNPEIIVDEIEGRIFSLMETRENREPVSIEIALEEAITQIEQRYSGNAIAMPTGLKDLDVALGGGLHKGSLNILAARPKMGKTSLGCTMALSAARAGGSIYFVSLEMPRREIGNRFIAISSGVPTDSVMHDHDASEKVIAALSQLKGLNVTIDDEPGITVAKLRSRARRLARKKGLDLIVVDYLQLMRGDGNNREQEISGISRALKGLAKEMDCPVLCMAQVNRDCESRQDKRPFMSDLRESGAIEADADLVMMIYRDEVYNKDSQYKGVAEILIRANRHGAADDIKCQFDGHITRFSNLAYCWVEPQPEKTYRRGI